MSSQQLDTDGYLLLRGLLSPDELARATDALERRLRDAAAAGLVLRRRDTVYAAREVLRWWPQALSLLALSELHGAITAAVRPDGGVVRAQLFDKPPRASWRVPWHRDVAIAVTSTAVLPPGFGHPTVKRGTPHVEAPAELCAQMVAARIHLDDASSRTGALRVAPGSHLGGEARSEVVIEARAGDVLLMRPSLLHASGSADGTSRRRVLHFELAPRDLLPPPLRWARFIPLP